MVNDDSRVVRMMLQVVASPTVVILMTRDVIYSQRTFIVQASLMVITIYLKGTGASLVNEMNTFQCKNALNYFQSNIFSKVNILPKLPIIMFK
jgi:hypothetical protein